MKYKFLPFAFFAVLLNFYLSAESFSREITLEMVHKFHLFTPEKINGLKSMNDGLHYTVLIDNSHIIKYEFRTGVEVDTVLSLDWLENEGISEISSYTLSDDESKILFSSGKEKIYRYSFRSDYFVYDLHVELLTPVYSDGKQQLATLSPDGIIVAFVFENNLWINNIETGKLTQVTTDGKKNFIINGSPDWVYEEEFALKTAFYWSPDSKKIAYYRFDESNVKEYSLVYYEGLYPELYTYKFPKAGEENSRVSINIYELDKEITTPVETSAYSDFYIPRIKWLPNAEELCITVLNRRQNKVDLLISGTINGITRIFYSEENTKYISEFTDDFVTFLDSGQTAIVMSEKDGFMHLYRYGINGNLINPVTAGEWEVDELLGIDENRGKVYYTSTEISPLERHVYAINIDGTGKEKISVRQGTNTATFSTSFDYYILEWSDANTPYEYNLFNREGELVRSLKDNSFVKEMVDYYDFSKKEFFTYTNKEGVELNAFRVLPPQFKKIKKYPVLIYVYGGPESQEVIDKWENNLAWFQYLAHNGYIVVCADNRGTDGRGEAFKKSTYLQLGLLETNDQIALAENMAKQSYVNQKKIGVFGWSYGGYMSLLCLMKGNHIFKCGVAVAPVTNWKFYDTVYTERFMQKPQENKQGYDNNSPLAHINHLKGELLLIHGTADDNVHFQNTVELLNKMIEKNKKFEFLMYPNQNHHMDKGNAKFHLYSGIDDFLNKNLK